MPFCITRNWATPLPTALLFQKIMLTRVLLALRMRSSISYKLLLACVLVCGLLTCDVVLAEDITLILTPSVCALSANDKECHTPVHAQWQSGRDESLCLIILDRPDIKRCWEHYSEGTYSIDLIFEQDVVFQLRDLNLENTLTSATLRVIREALQYRRKRRDPWALFG